MLHQKERGLVLSIDQASNLAGVSLWDNDQYQAGTVLKSKSPKDPFGRRVTTQVEQLTLFLDQHLSGRKLDHVIFEGVKSRLVLVVIGAFCTCVHLQHCKVDPKKSFIYPLQWKRYMASLGARGKVSEIKGVRALRDTGWDFEKHPIDSEDLADSCHIYRCWVSKQ